MDIQIFRCKHCGNHYRLQLSGYNLEKYNTDRSDDYCSECYALIKEELQALENKLRTPELVERNNRYKHAYIEDPDVTEEQLVQYWDKNWPGRIPHTDSWGYTQIPWKTKHRYCRFGKVYKKILIDTKENKKVANYCSEPYKYKDSVNRCTSWNE